MREHKYQAWHKKLKRMHQVVGINFTLQELNMGDPTQKGFNEHWYISDVELREYTGLKDSKGKEIYEGDIIKTGVSKRGIVGPFVGRVYWYESEFQWWITDDKNNPVIGIDYDLSFLNAYQDFEVIGNIYENSELMSQKG